MDKYILIKQKKSNIKQSKVFKMLLNDLGLIKINKQIFVKNTHLIRKKIFRIQHLLFIENKYI